MRSKTHSDTRYHPVCLMTVVLASFRTWKILAGPLSVPGMQCKAAKTTSSRCGGLSGKVSEPFRCCTDTCSLFFRRGFLIGFVFFSSLEQSCYIAVSHWWWLSKLQSWQPRLQWLWSPGQGGIFHRLQMDFQLPQKKQELERFSAEARAFCGAWLCWWWSMRSSLHFCMSCYAQSCFEETNNLWPSSHPSSQSSWISGKSYVLHLHFLLPSHCTAHVLGHVLVHNRSTIAKGLIHWWVPPLWHMSQM